LLEISQQSLNIPYKSTEENRSQGAAVPGSVSPYLYFSLSKLSETIEKQLIQYMWTRVLGFSRAATGTAGSCY